VAVGKRGLPSGGSRRLRACLRGSSNVGVSRCF
jgi:hypothetical protein